MSGDSEPIDARDSDARSERMGRRRRCMRRDIEAERQARIDRFVERRIRVGLIRQKPEPKDPAHEEAKRQLAGRLFKLIEREPGHSLDRIFQRAAPSAPDDVQAALRLLRASEKIWSIGIREERRFFPAARGPVRAPKRGAIILAITSNSGNPERVRVLNVSPWTPPRVVFRTLDRKRNLTRTTSNMAKLLLA